MPEFFLDDLPTHCILAMDSAKKCFAKVHVMHAMIGGTLPSSNVAVQYLLTALEQFMEKKSNLNYKNNASKELFSTWRIHE